MKLVLHELRAARDRLSAGELAPAFKMLARVSRIMEQLVHAWDVLATLTPAEYAAMRPSLGTSSGFQSWQYREIEFLLGNRRLDTLAAHRHDPAILGRLEQALAEPSIHDVAIQRLVHAGLLEPAPMPPTDADLERAWLAVYRAPEQHWDLYQLAEELIDLEDAFRQWRFRHLTTVARIIGSKPGTGGSSGVDYLRRQLDIVLFPQLWSVRAAL